MPSFIFSYISICPAISIILSDKKIVNSQDNKKNLLQWLDILFKIFNKIMKTNIYSINEDDLNDQNKLFLRVFKMPIWPYSENALSSTKIWGIYIWALLHTISLFWTKNNSYNICNPIISIRLK